MQSSLKEQNSMIKPETQIGLPSPPRASTLVLGLSTSQHGKDECSGVWEGGDFVSLRQASSSLITPATWEGWVGEGRD